MSVDYSGAATEVDLPWGGDFSYDSTGDLILAVDNATSPNATTQRLVRLVLTAPNIVVNGATIAYADDIFHPDWGAGLRAYVSENFTPALLTRLSNDIGKQLAMDPAVAVSPAPTVSLTLVSVNAASLVVTWFDNNGQKQTLPTIALLGGAVTVGGTT